MVARMRPWNLEGMFGPRAEARAHAARGSAALGAGIERGLDAFGEGLVDRRKEAESKRRFGIEKGFEERRLRVAEHGAALDAERMDILREEKLEKAAAADGLLDNIVQMSERFGVMGALGVSPSDKEWGDFNASIDALGGQQAVAGALQVREKNAGALPTAEQDDIFDLDARMRQNAEARTQVDALMKQVGTMTKGRTGPKAMLAWTKLLNAKGMLDAEGASLQRRYALAGKQVKKQEDVEAATTLRAQKQAAMPGYRQMAQENGISAAEQLALFQGWLNDDKAPVRSIEQGLFRERTRDQADARQKSTEAERAKDNARQEEAMRLLQEERAKDNKRADESAADAREARGEATTYRALNEVQQALNSDADRRAEVAYGKGEITQEQKEARYAVNRADRVAKLRLAGAANLQRAYYSGTLNDDQRKQVEEAYGGVPPRPETAAPPQAAPAPAAQAPAPQQAQPFRIPQVQGRGSAAAQRAFNQLPPEQRSAAAWQAIKAHYCGPGG